MKYLKCLAPFLVCLVCFTSNVQASGFGGASGGGLPGTEYSLSGTTTTTEVVLVVGNTISWVAVTTSTGAFGGSAQNATNRQRFLALHQRALATDMTVGGGRHLKDLSALYGIPKKHFKAFAKVVRKDARWLCLSLSHSSTDMAVVDTRLLHITSRLKKSVEG